MKNLKKLFATMLCLVTVLCSTATAFAAEAPRASDPDVAEVTIFSTTGDRTIGSINIDGHSWIAVKNISSSKIKVGNMNIGVGHEITIGTWGNITQHKGLWYNIESYAVNNLGAYGDRVSLTTTIKQSELSKLNTAISNNTGWTYLGPCSTAAANIWNTVSGTKLSAGIPSTPTALRKSIMSKSGYETNRAIQDMTPIGYTNASGNFVSMKYSEIVWEEDDGGSSSSAITGEIPQ